LVDELATLHAARRITLGEQLAAAARKRPDRAALRAGGVGMTYAELDARASRVASALADRGVDPGDRVLLLATNSFEWVEALFGICRLGAVAVPINYRLVAAEVAGIVDDCEPAAAVVEAGLLPLLAESPAIGVVLAFGGEAGAGAPGTHDYETVLAEASGGSSVEVRNEDLATICFTSGTTGRPKGAMLTHANLALDVLSVNAILGLTEPDEVWAGGSPLFHIGGFGDLLLLLPICGTFVILPTGHFDPAATVDLLEREQVTGCSFVPTQWHEICALPEIKERPLARQLRRAGYSAAASTMVLLETLNETFPVADRIHAFGQTEMSPTTTILHGEDAVRKIGSVGRPIPGVEARIVDDEMHDVPVGSVGEIVYRGPHVFAGYWNRPDEDAAAFAGGWFHSGDLCRSDDEGYIYVVDRKKDMIISGGENIYSAEVENAIASHPGVREVAVVGVPHEVWGETPAAAVVALDPAAPPTGAEIIAHCRARLASHKKPTVVAVFDQLPHNASGKVLKPALRRLIIERNASQ
jgi:fatty-acyl-CoA synthase/long-chain acyl-CoA synthetase